jgi:hypothetical protein
MVNKIHINLGNELVEWLCFEPIQNNFIVACPLLNFHTLCTGQDVTSLIIKETNIIIKAGISSKDKNFLHPVIYQAVRHMTNEENFFILDFKITRFNAGARLNHLWYDNSDVSGDPLKLREWKANNRILRSKIDRLPKEFIHYVLAMTDQRSFDRFDYQMNRKYGQ